jgi:hypothetical protein
MSGSCFHNDYFVCLIICSQNADLTLRSPEPVSIVVSFLALSACVKPSSFLCFPFSLMGVVRPAASPATEAEDSMISRHDDVYVGTILCPTQ